jgi:PAT family beta-lactamase induction signal transducer AmpG
MNNSLHYSKFYQFFIIFGLGFLSGLPTSMYGTTLQAWFTQSGSSLLLISSLSLLNVSFLLRFIWGPVVDKYYNASLGRRKTWLILIQLILFACIEVMAWSHPSNSVTFLLSMGFLLAFFSSIQDLVIDAHRIEFLPKDLFGFGAVVAIYAYRIALLVSGGVALIMAQEFGFAKTYAILGLFYVLGIFLVFKSPEPKCIRLNDEYDNGPYLDFLKQKNLLILIGLVIFTKFGEVFVSNTSPMIIPFMMRGLGLSLSYIAYVNKIFGLAAQLLGSAIAAFFVWRFSLLNLLMLFGMLEVVSNSLFILVSMHTQHMPLLWFTIGFENLATGLCSTVTVAYLMNLVNPKYTATQFSLWIMIAIIPKLISGPLGGYLSTHFGWTFMFECSTALTICFLFFWWRLKRRESLELPREIMPKMMSSSER